MYTPSDYFLYILHKSSPLPTGQLSPPGKGEEQEEINKIEGRQSKKISSRSFSSCFDALQDNLVCFQGMQTRGRGKLVE
jgi:hypothetical protein